MTNLLKPPFKTYKDVVTFLYRGYLGVMAAIYGILATFMIAGPRSWYTSNAYENATAIAPIQWWGVLFLVSAVFLGIATWKNRAKIARYAVANSAAVTMIWGTMLFLSFLANKNSAPNAFFIWTAHTCVHVLMSYIPSTVLEDQ